MKQNRVGTRIVHRVGELQVADQIVFVGVTSKHRKHAFDAAEFLMDALKTQAPFWKKERDLSGDMAWVSSSDSDAEMALRWKN